MQKSETKNPKPAFGIQDILVVLFKHKWKILICSFLGLAAAASVYFTRKPLYESNGKILINYVLKRGGADAREKEVETGGRSGGDVINTELEILRSGDLAAEVAEKVGIDRILDAGPEPATLADAAEVVRGGLEVAPVSKGSNVVLLTYRNPDAKLTRDILREVMNLYPNKHLEIHRSVGEFDAMAKRTKEVRERLRSTEEELNKLKAESGIVSVGGESLSFAEQRDKTKQDLVNAEAQRDGQIARVEALRRRIGDVGPPRAIEVEATEPSRPAAPTPAEIEEYRELAKQLDRYQQTDFELRAKYAAGSSMIVRNQREIDRIKTQRNALLAKKPGLAMEATAEEGGEAVLDPRVELAREEDSLREVEARIKRYQLNLTELEKRFELLSTLGPRMTDLERRKEMEDAEYRLLESNLKKAEVDHNLDPTNLSNLKVIEHPSIPEKTFGELTKKIILGLAGAGVAIGLGIAFLLELVVDRRIKSAGEIESRLQVPLLLSIPYIQPKNQGSLLISTGSPDEVAEPPASNLPAIREGGTLGKYMGKSEHFIQPYSEAIRDRIVFNFQLNNMTHKPKMMAVTGLSAGSGTSTIAAGLAKAFSEVNGAKVLLVDLNSDHVDDNPMFADKPMHSLAGALQTARNTRFKEGSQNLYLASAATRKSETPGSTFGPMHLYEMLPHFRASDFDYVIFDMPPMDQTSPTLAMAGLMDKVLLVADGEDTSRESLKWGYSELLKGRADVSCVFNKAKTHAPRWISGGM